VPNENLSPSSLALACPLPNGVRRIEDDDGRPVGINKKSPPPAGALQEKRTASDGLLGYLLDSAGPA